MCMLFIDCLNGLAGDMLSGALLELFPDKALILHKLNAMGIPGIRYAADKVYKHGVSGIHMRVSYEGAEETQGFDNQTDSSISDPYKIIDSINAPERAKIYAKQSFRLLEETEQKIHGASMNNIHNNILGTMDAIADICAVAYMLCELEIDKVCVSPVRTGFGSFRSRYGNIPIPTPASSLLLEHVPHFTGDIEGEMCTPTGLSMISTLADSYLCAPPMHARATGRGFGSKDFGKLTCVQVGIGQSGHSNTRRGSNVY